MIIDKIISINSKFVFFSELYKTGLIDSTNDFFKAMYDKVVQFQVIYYKNDLDDDDICEMLRLNEEFDVLRFKLYKFLTERRTC